MSYISVYSKEVLTRGSVCVCALLHDTEAVSLLLRSDRVQMSVCVCVCGVSSVAMRPDRK